MNVTSFGMAADSIAKVTDNSAYKIFGAKKYAVAGALVTLFGGSWPDFTVKVYKEGVEAVHEFTKVFTMSIGNAKFAGDGWVQCPDGSPTSRTLNTVVSHDMSQTFLIGTFASKWRRGTQLELSDNVKGFESESVEVSWGSGEERGIECDGELFYAMSPVRFSVRPGILNVLTMDMSK